MKKFKITLFLAIASTLFVGCNDAIDIQQPSELLPENTFQSVEDLELGLNGVYGAVPGENAVIFTSIFTDEVAVGIANGGQGLDGSLAFTLNAGSGDAASIWVSNYYLINLANRLIDGAQYVEVEPGSDEEAQKNNILAQARALRAYGHFVLESYFSPDMTDDSALGVIALDFVPQSDAQLPRNTNAEVYELINSDLDYAVANIEDVTILDKTHVGLNFIKALKARMAAYRGHYDEAKTYVDDLDVTYNLTPKNAYAAIWQDVLAGSPATDEVIFKLERAKTGSTGNWYQAWASVNSTINGSPFFEVNRALFNLVDNPNDVRRLIVVDPSAETAGKIMGPEYMTVSDADYKNNDVLPVGKYPGSESQTLLNDVKVFRFSEMVLIRAEYYASVGDYTNAIAQVNAIRTARYGNASGNIDVPNNPQDVWYAIMNERRAELCFEGHRYLDIKRLGPLAGRGVERDPRDCAFNNECTLAPEDHRFTLPIPLSELDANPNITQNPGYGNN